MIKKGTPSIIFKEEDHTYWIEQSQGISVTTLISQFSEPMDEPYWHTNGAFKKVLGEDQLKALKKDYLKSIYLWKMPFIMKPPRTFFDKLSYYVNPDEFFEAKNEVKQEWKDAGILGTKFHKEIEDELYKSKLAINPHTQKEVKVIIVDKTFDNENIVDDLYDLEDGCYVELLVWGKFDNIYVVGQIDLAFIETIDGVRYVDVDDHKTNKKLGKKESYYKFNEPFQHLSASKLVKYQLQQSMYCYLLELAGYTVRNLSITHYTDYDVNTAKQYTFEYLRDEVKEMINIVDELNS
jgi:hypothetical protein